MKYRGDKKFYIDIGFREDYTRHNHRKFHFKLFFLIKKALQQGEMIRFGRDYIGVVFESRSWEDDPYDEKV